jgi:hypothetical protein
MISFFSTFYLFVTLNFDPEVEGPNHHILFALGENFLATNTYRTVYTMFAWFDCFNVCSFYVIWEKHDYYVM